MFVALLIVLLPAILTVGWGLYQLQPAVSAQQKSVLQFIAYSFLVALLSTAAIATLIAFADPWLAIAYPFASGIPTLLSILFVTLYWRAYSKQS